MNTNGRRKAASTKERTCKHCGHNLGKVTLRYYIEHVREHGPRDWRGRRYL